MFGYKKFFCPIFVSWNKNIHGATCICNFVCEQRFTFTSSVWFKFVSWLNKSLFSFQADQVIICTVDGPFYDHSAFTWVVCCVPMYNKTIFYCLKFSWKLYLVFQLFFYVNYQSSSKKFNGTMSGRKESTSFGWQILILSADYEVVSCAGTDTAQTKFWFEGTIFSGRNLKYGSYWFTIKCQWPDLSYLLSVCKPDYYIKLNKYIHWDAINEMLHCNFYEHKLGPNVSLDINKTSQLVTGWSLLILDISQSQK